MDGSFFLMTNLDKEYKPPVMKRIGGVFLLAIGLVVLGFTIFFSYDAQNTGFFFYKSLGSICK